MTTKYREFTEQTYVMAVGVAKITARRIGQDQKYDLGETTKEQPPLITANAEYISHTVTELGALVVQKIHNGENFQLTMQVPKSDTLERLLTQNIEVTDSTIERNARIAGTNAEKWTVNIHPIAEGANRSGDINLLCATVSVNPNITFNNENVSYIELIFDCMAANIDMETIADSTFTAAAIDGGSLAAATYSYKVTATDLVFETEGSVTKQATTETTNLSVELKFNRVYGAKSYKIYRSNDNFATNIEFLEIADDPGVNQQVFVDDGSYTFDTIAAVPTTTEAKALSTVRYGVSIDKIKVNKAA